ncbi:radical SAM protein [uncultured Endozoicomonas sp.]|uniref:radical SAM protein n=1 Tax=uncultured Endozoicomonas sp. TaxID=432652 RepID=UPI002636C8A3|nr:radical SAM protein [uncultured Endozoicomonas sp.]
MNKIRQSLLVTFDFSQRGKSGTGLAAASLISACRSHEDYGTSFLIEHLPIRMPVHPEKRLSHIDVYNQITSHNDIQRIDSLIIACYVWSSDLVNPLIAKCRENGFTGKIILGGYQIHRATCKTLYPDGDIYIPGYGEAALPKAILMDRHITSQVVEEKVDFEHISSPFLDGSFQLEYGMDMIHWETSRGCQFKCNFCAHRDLVETSKDRVHPMGFDKIKAELDLFKKFNVKKINVLDPVFNRGDLNKKVLKYAISINLQSLLSLQVRFELIDEEFLFLCKQLNVELEFGLQTAIEKEYRIIERPNHMPSVGKAISLLTQFKQPFEVSLIYGLPEQTFNSFKQSIQYLTDRCNCIIKAFPLMLLEGTELINQKDKFGLKEDVIDESKIPHVVESHSFTRQEWQKMHNHAKSLTNNMEAA